MADFKNRLIAKIKNKFDFISCKRTSPNLINTLKKELKSVTLPPYEEGKDNDWVKFLQKVKTTLLECDLNKFLRTDIFQYTMFVSNASYSMNEFSFLRTRPDWSTRWEKAISETGVGWPVYSRHCAASSDNLIHQAHHIAFFEARTKTALSQMDFIFEFGGGFGAMARLAHRLNFRGEYRIFDFPMILALQRFYLAASKVKTTTPPELIGISNTSCIPEIQNSITNEMNSLFIAMWSFSECPLELRNLFLPFIRNFKYVFFAFQSSFSDIDNIKFFNSLQEEMNNYQWSLTPIEGINGSFYLIGIKKI